MSNVKIGLYLILLTITSGYGLTKVLEPTLSDFDYSDYSLHYRYDRLQRPLQPYVGFLEPFPDSDWHFNFSVHFIIRMEEDGKLARHEFLKSEFCEKAQNLIAGGIPSDVKASPPPLVQFAHFYGWYIAIYYFPYYNDGVNHRPYPNVTDTYYFFAPGVSIIKFLGLGDEYKGEIGLNRNKQKILFFGNDQPFHDYFNGRTGKSTYIEVAVKNQKHEIVKNIIINGTNSMYDVIAINELNRGLDYEYGYMIEVTMKEISRTYFMINDKTNYTNYKRDPAAGDNYEHRQFKIINDRLISLDYYEQQYQPLLVEWRQNFKLWNEEMIRQLQNYVPTLNTIEKRIWKNNNQHLLLDKLHSLHQDVQIIANGEEITELRSKITRLKDDIDDKFKDVYDMITRVKNQLEQMQMQTAVANSITCARTMSLISPISSLVPGAGTILSAITGIVAASCALIEV